MGAADAVESPTASRSPLEPSGAEKPPIARTPPSSRRSSGRYVHCPHLPDQRLLAAQSALRYGSRKILTQTCEAAAGFRARWSVSSTRGPARPVVPLEAGVGRSGWRGDAGSDVPSLPREATAGRLDNAESPAAVAALAHASARRRSRRSRPQVPRAGLSASTPATSHVRGRDPRRRRRRARAITGRLRRPASRPTRAIRPAPAPIATEHWRRARSTRPAASTMGPQPTPRVVEPPRRPRRSDGRS